MSRYIYIREHRKVRFFIVFIDKKPDFNADLFLKNRMFFMPNLTRMLKIRPMVTSKFIFLEVTIK